MGAFVGAAVIVVDAKGRAVGDAVGVFVGEAVIVVDAEGRAVGGAVGAFVGAADGDAVRVLAMHTVPLYVAVASNAQSASLVLKNLDQSISDEGTSSSWSPTTSPLSPTSDTSSSGQFELPSSRNAPVTASTSFWFVSAKSPSSSNSSTLFRSIFSRASAQPDKVFISLGT